MNYNEALSWLYEQFPAYQKKGVSAYKPNLDNIFYLINQLNIDYSSQKFVHIAGTNGKGSTAALIASSLTESGYKVGLFTSPHIKEFTERIRINGKEIEQASVLRFIENIQAMSLSISPSFFEITWAMALDYFIENKCDIIVVETGLGGRLDSTNVITPLLSVITNIGFDHTDLLGNTLSEIAFEKAGIIKNNVSVLIGDYNNDTLEVFQKVANERKSKLILADLSLTDDFKEKNEKLAFKAIEILNESGFDVLNDSFLEGVKNLYQNTGLIGRVQVLSEKPLIIADAAHNTEGIESLFKLIKKRYSNKKLHLIFGSSKDKNHTAIFKLFPKSVTLSLCVFQNERSLSENELRTLKEQNGLKANIYLSPQTALKKVKNIANEDDVILIFGSFFLLEEFF